MDTAKIAEFLRALRKAKGLTQEEVAQRLYLSPKTISRWESGGGIPDINIISAVADLYGVTVDEILKGERSTERTESRSEQTKKLKDESGERVMYEHIAAKLNPYLVGSVITLCVTSLISVFFWPATVAIIPCLVLFASIIMAIGNGEVRRLVKDGYGQGFSAAMDRAKGIVLRKNLWYADVVALILIIWAFATAGVLQFFTVNVALFIAVAAGCYILLRIGAVVCSSAKERVSLLYIASAVLFAHALLCMMNVDMYAESGSVSIRYESTLLAFTFFHSIGWHSLALKVVSACLLALCLSAVVCGAVFKSWWLYAVALAMGIAANVVGILDERIIFNYVDPFAVISFVAGVAVVAYAAVQTYRLKKAEK